MTTAVEVAAQRYTSPSRGRGCCVPWPAWWGLCSARGPCTTCSDRGPGSALFCICSGPCLAPVTAPRAPAQPLSAPRGPSAPFLYLQWAWPSPHLHRWPRAQPLYLPRWPRLSPCICTAGPAPPRADRMITWLWHPGEAPARGPPTCPAPLGAKVGPQPWCPLRPSRLVEPRWRQCLSGTGLSYSSWGPLVPQSSTQPGRNSAWQPVAPGLSSLHGEGQPGNQGCRPSP